MSAALTRLRTDNESCVIDPAATKAAPDATAPWLAAWHFCKHSDARRQDGVLVAKSLSYQFSLRYPDFADKARG